MKWSKTKGKESQYKQEFQGNECKMPILKEKGQASNFF